MYIDIISHVIIPTFGEFVDTIHCLSHTYQVSVTTSNSPSPVPLAGTMCVGGALAAGPSH